MKKKKSTVYTEKMKFVLMRKEKIERIRKG